MGFLGDLFGGDAPDYSGMNRAAEANAAISKEALEWSKKIYDETAPQREETQRRANAVSDAQLEATRKNTAISDDYWKYQKDTFRPLEQGIVDAAATYDTPQRQQAEADAAVAGVQSQLQKQQQATAIEMARMGVNPDSGRMAAVAGMQDIEAAKAAAGADYKARKAVETQGYARKMDAANLGRNLASNQATSAQIATTTGNSAVANSGVANATGMSGVGVMQTGFNTALQGNQSAGNLYGQVAQMDVTQRGQDLAFLSSAMGSAATAYKSDENIKTKTGKKMSPAQALGAIEKTPVHEGWEYDPAKGGPDDGGAPHDGPMAQDVQANMGEKVAPGGKVIDMVSMNGVLMAGVQQLAKEVKSLKKQMAAAKQGAYA